MKRIFTPAKKKTILMVDDDQSAVGIYREKLEANGFRIETADDSDHAFETLKKGIVDLVIVDLCLPGTNAVELIKNIRSDSATQALPIIAFSNPYLSSLTRSATEAGATRCVAKIESTPAELSDLMRELGITATARIADDPIGTTEVNCGKMAAAFLGNESKILAELRACHQVFARAGEEDSRRTQLLEMHRQLRSLSGGARLLGFEKIARMSTALEALLVELYNKPAKITPSVVRTVAQAIDTLASLFDRAASSEEMVPSKTLVVDDEIISRETICSALSKAGLEPSSLDDPLAAQRLLEQEHFDLIFLDVEMPGQTGLELCVKIREMAPNRTTPIVFVTSHSDFGSRAQSTLSGGNDFIAKPFLLVELAVKALTWLFKENPALPATATTAGPVPGVHEGSASGVDTPRHEHTATE